MGHARLTQAYAGTGWISLDPRDYVQNKIFREGFYEPEVWEALSTWAISEEVVWDIGAHIGGFAIRAGLDARVRQVHCFEPDPRQVEVLSDNLSMNRGRFAVHPFALSDHREIRPMTRGPAGNLGQTSLIPDIPNHQDVFDVPCDTIDDLVFGQRIPSPTLMKIDVEGWEWFVLQGAQRLLSEKPPKAIVFEDHCQPDGRPTDTKLLDFLQKLGYESQRILRRSGKIEGNENFLAVRPLGRHER